MPPTWKKWTDREIKFLKSYGARLSVEAISQKIERSEKAIRNKCERIGVKLSKRKRSTYYRNWTQREINIVRENYSRTCAKIVTLLPHRTKSGIQRIRSRLGLSYRNAPRFNSAGYQVYCTGFGQDKRQTIMVHREIYSEYIGRKLTKKEIVHHIDINKQNNKPKNLYLCRNRQYHRLVHYSFEVLLPRLMERNLVRFNREKGQYELCEI